MTHWLSLSRRFGNTQISTKLLAAFGLLLSLTAIVDGLSYVALTRVNQAAGTLAEVWLPGVGALTAARADMLVVREFEVKHTHATDDSYRSEYEEKLNIGLRDVQRHIDGFKSLGQSGDGSLIVEFEKRWQEYLVVNAKIINLSRSGKQEDAQEIGDGAGKSSMDDALAALDRLIDYDFTQGKAAGAHSREVYRSTLIVGLLTASLILILGTALTWAIVRSITHPISEAVRVAQSVAAGDFTSAVEVNGTNETGQLLNALKSMQSVLRDNETEALNAKGQIAAINKVQAVVELNLDGTIRSANDNFLKAVGYEANALRGQHYDMLVDRSQRETVEHRQFWEQLRRGEYVSGRFRRITRDGKSLWLRSSFNPILGSDGRPYKIVEYSGNITAQVKMEESLDSAVSETHAIVRAALDGKLTARIATDDKTGQIQALAGNINALIDNMMTVVAEIKRAANEVQASAQEISSGTSNLNERTEEQAASLEEAASSMEQMTATVKETADNAGQARQLAEAAAEQATKGGEVVQSAVAAMGDINHASKKIADIIGIIDEIAFQTNLLALNAAVEAARAGEQGRGFAVVAAEVRTLAGRSAAAAKEIKALINDSVAKVDQGNKLVDQCGRSLGDISAAITRVTSVVADIAQASSEQASGIAQVNHAVTQMDDNTQRNAKLVEESSTASAAILAQATHLANLVDRYHVAETPSDDVTRVALAKDAHLNERRGDSRPWSPRDAARGDGTRAFAPKRD
jgi:PAS domain S-box-containing protein